MLENIIKYIFYKLFLRGFIIAIFILTMNLPFLIIEQVAIIHDIMMLIDLFVTVIFSI